MNKLLIICLFVLKPFVGFSQTQTPKAMGMYDKIHLYFEKADHLSPLEGIWKVEIKREFYHFDTLYDVQDVSDTTLIAIARENDAFSAYYIYDKSKSVELAAFEFSTTDVDGVFMYRMLTDSDSKKHAIICTHGKMEYTYDIPEDEVVKYLENNYRSNTRIVNILKWKKISPGNR